MFESNVMENILLEYQKLSLEYAEIFTRHKQLRDKIIALGNGYECGGLKSVVRYQ